MMCVQLKWVSRKLAHKSGDLVGVDCEKNGSNLDVVKAGADVFPSFFHSLPVFK